MTYTYEWYENGVLTSYTSTMIPASDVDVNDVWTVRVTPNDGYHDGSYAEASVVISNSPPTVTTPVITSSAGSFYNDAIFTCTATASDADETVSATYTWNIAGQTAVGATVNLSSYGVMPSDTVTCTASVQDSNGGMASSSVDQVVANRLPSISQAAISPSTAHSNSLVTCSAVVSDPDGESTTDTYTWSLNGSPMGTGDTLQLDESFASAGDVLYCTVDVLDASGGAAQTMTSLTIQSGAQILIRLLRSHPILGITQNTALTCTAVVTDPDGGTPMLSYQWMVNSSPVGTGSTWTVNTSQASAGDSITCLMSAVDSDGNTASSLSPAVTVDNSAPVISSATLNTLTPQTNDALTVSVISSDADGDAVTYQYDWYKEDASNGNMLTLVLSGTGSSFSTLVSKLF